MSTMMIAGGSIIIAKTKLPTAATWYSMLRIHLPLEGVKLHKFSILVSSIILRERLLSH